MPRPTLEPSQPVTIRNAQLRFRNFSGNPGQFNAAGDRNVCVFLDDDFAVELAQMGWNVKFTKPRQDDPEEYRQPYIQITVKYAFRPPRIVTITTRGKTDLDESTVKMLDVADIERADLIFVPYHWDMAGKTGVTAYLKSLFVTLNEDELEQEYGDVPDANAHAEVPADFVQE
jgi:hypothetical protein